jgi:signal-transduction protein with cAMP-binding, CBS, and nucleotidyltransferase domain
VSASVISIDDQTRALLKKVPYFETLDEAALQAVAQQVTVHHFQSGELIFWEDDPNAGLHLVVEGSCKVFRVSTGGREHVLAMLGPGDSCNEVPGWMAVLIRPILLRWKNQPCG